MINLDEFGLMPIEIQKEIAGKEKERRKKKGITQKELASSFCVIPFFFLLSFSFPAISFWISIGINPNSSRLIIYQYLITLWKKFKKISKYYYLFPLTHRLEIKSRLCNYLLLCYHLSAAADK